MTIPLLMLTILLEGTAQTAGQFDIISALFITCPALGVMGWWIRELRVENKALRLELKGANDTIVELARDQIKVNTELKGIIEYKMK